MSLAYRPPAHIAVVLSGKLATNRDVAFWVEAWRLQLRDHVCPAWGWDPPGIQVYSIDDVYVPKAEGCVLSIADDDFNPSTAGFHGVLGGQPYGIVDLAQGEGSVVGSHENNEIAGNSHLDIWVSRPDGSREARELSDAVQRDTYPIEVELFGEKRLVRVANFVLPAYFEAGSSGPWDWMGRLSAPFTVSPGGYQILIGADGMLAYHAADAFGASSAERKIREMSDWSRTGRIARAANAALGWLPR